MRPDHRDEIRPPGLQLFGPDTGNRAEFGKRFGALVRHVAQHRIMEDDIGRDAVFGREFLAPRPQGLEQRIADRVGRIACTICA